jgi:WD40 repeat protein
VTPEAVDPADVVPSPSAIQQVWHDDQVREVAFTPDGRLLATSSIDRTARVWEVASGQERTRVTHEGIVRGVAFSPDGRLLATGSYDDSARVWALVR